jgi:hypothetical protein
MFERESHVFEYHASKVFEIEAGIKDFKRLENERHVTRERKLERAKYDPAQENHNHH